MSSLIPAVLLRTCAVCLHFVETLQANTFAEGGIVANVTITMVVLGSVVVTNIVALTGAHSASAVAARNALATVLQSGDVTAIYGSSFGTVTVSGISSTTTSNPSQSVLAPIQF